MSDKRKKPADKERRSGGERRNGDRRKRKVPVPVDRRSGSDRREGGDRRHD